MIKTILGSTLSLLCVASLHAQSAPGQSPAAPVKPGSPPIAPAPASAAVVPGATAIAKNPPPLDPKNIDTSVQPQDDFYKFANGNWLKNNPIPPEYSRWGSFNELIEKNNDTLHVIAENAAKATADTAKPDPKKAVAPEVQMVGDFYASGMNEEQINSARLLPLKGELKQIDAISDLASLSAEIGHFHSLGLGALFDFTSGQDDKQSTMVIAQAFQGGLGLPDRDYYTKNDDASKKLREQYVAHVTKMFSLLGDKPDVAAAAAQTVMKIETALAKPARTRVELRDPQKNYNKMSEAGLQKLTPDFKWHDYFQVVGLPVPGAINVGQPDFFEGANDVFKNVSIDDWKTYLRWHLIHSTAPTLGRDFVDENFAFFGKTLSGTEKLKPRWKRVVSVIDNEIGEALGKL
ncbi:MAG: M13 family metallopeptidase N-terminal domain-containing protein, partial [Chthoniobacterales bacterium]